jgi:hypothetical protein
VVMCFPSKHEAEHKNPVLPKNIHWFSSAMWFNNHFLYDFLSSIIYTYSSKHKTYIWVFL